MSSTSKDTRVNFARYAIVRSIKTNRLVFGAGYNRFSAKLMNVASRGASKSSEKFMFGTIKLKYHVNIYQGVAHGDDLSLLIFLG